MYANERQVESKRKQHQRLPVLCTIPSTHLKANTHTQKKKEKKKKQKRRSRIETRASKRLTIRQHHHHLAINGSTHGGWLSDWRGLCCNEAPEAYTTAARPSRRLLLSCLHPHPPACLQTALLAPSSPSTAHATGRTQDSAPDEAGEGDARCAVQAG